MSISPGLKPSLYLAAFGQTACIDITVFALAIEMPIDHAGVFGGAGIRGRFHGPGHEEAGGVFLRDRISGAFGASR